MIIPWSNKFLYFIISSAPLIESEPVEFVAQLVTIANNDRTLCALPAYNLNVRLSDLTFPAGRKLIYIVGQKEFFVVILILYSEISFRVFFWPIFPPTIAPTPPKSAPPTTAPPRLPLVICSPSCNSSYSIISSYENIMVDKN